MLYSFDTSALINGWHKHYKIANFPGIWENLEELIEKKLIRAVDEVRLEIAAQDDDLLEWVKQRSTIFVSLDENIQETASSIISNFPKLININRRQTQADPFVIALAQIHDCSVVTYEKLDDNLGTKKTSIPKVCRELGIKCITLAELIEEQCWVFR